MDIDTTRYDGGMQLQQLANHLARLSDKLTLAGVPHNKADECSILAAATDVVQARARTVAVLAQIAELSAAYSIRPPVPPPPAPVTFGPPASKFTPSQQNAVAQFAKETTSV